MFTLWDESRCDFKVKDRDECEYRGSDQEVDLRRWVGKSSAVIPVEDCNEVSYVFSLLQFQGRFHAQEILFLPDNRMRYPYHMLTSPRR